MSDTRLRAAFRLYELAWAAAIPFLARNKRLREGFAQRTLAEDPPAKTDLWIQAASAGEANLAFEIVKRFAAAPPPPFGPKRPLRVLVTTNTTQGLDTLSRAGEAVLPGAPLLMRSAYMPFDRPSLVERAVQSAYPRVAVLLETELWPGFMAAIRRIGARLLVLNARMTAKSLGGYLALGGLLRELAPDRVLAVSERDGLRYGTLFGQERVEVMANMKFDRMAASAPAGGDLGGVVPEGGRLVVLGAVRREEGGDVAQLAAELVRARPDAVLGLFPRHMHHLAFWRETLTQAGLPVVVRSELAGPAAAGSVVLWDVFGELARAYGSAAAAFVGGSLARLGGQNFLEAISGGVVPVIGPYWSNFAWVGREIVTAGLVREVADWREAAAALSAQLAAPPAREAVREAGLAYIRERQGGTAQACARIAEALAGAYT
jgi:3-deoxy-D-manno-octulosonic-acid transferase